MEIIKDAHAKARAILENDIEKLHELSAYLLEKETITGEEFMYILKNLCIFWNTAGRKPKTKLPVKLLIQPQQRLTKVQKPKNLPHRPKKQALRNKLYLLD